MSVQEQERKLIALVEEYRDRECNQLFEQARKTKQDMILAVYRDARQHLHHAVERERARAISRIRTAEAELHTKRRAVEQRFAESFLKEGWQLLEQALLKQWQDHKARLVWIERGVTEALERLPVNHWTVQHPNDCTPEELKYISNLITAGSVDAVVNLQAVADIKAGLIIGTANTHLDMSIEGLLRDKQSLEARLLALLNGGNKK